MLSDNDIAQMDDVELRTLIEILQHELFRREGDDNEPTFRELTEEDAQELNALISYEAEFEGDEIK